MKTCPTCKKIYFPELSSRPPHQCGPCWLVWDESYGTADSDFGEGQKIYESTAEYAASEYCRQCDDDGPETHQVYVRAIDSTEPARLLLCRPEIHVTYNVS